MVRRVVDDSYKLPKPKTGTIASRIVIAMTAAGIKTAQGLSVRTKSPERPKGIGRQTIHRWLLESADQVDPKLLFIVAEALDVAPRWLALGGDNMAPPRHLTHEESAILELAHNLEQLHDGSKDLWMKDGYGRLDTAKVRASKSLPYITSR